MARVVKVGVPGPDGVEGVEPWSRDGHLKPVVVVGQGAQWQEQVRAWPASSG